MPLPEFPEPTLGRQLLHAMTTMLTVIPIVLPIFGLILAGWVARRIGVFSAHATGELNRFVVYLALPALLFDIVAKARWSDIWQTGFIAAFTISTGLVFVLTVVLRLRGPRNLADAAIDGLNAAYANTGFIGFPLVVAALGHEGLAPTLIATIVTVCVLFALALILIEIGIQTERHPARMAMKVSKSLGTNPLLVAPLAGGIFLAFGIATPTPVERFLTLLGSAASPCALVALGLFLAEKREAARAPFGHVAALVTLKLLIHPLATWLLAARILHLSPILVHTAVLMSALPTGTGPFMVSEFYGREAGMTSRVVLLSTIVSVLTLTAYLALAAR